VLVGQPHNIVRRDAQPRFTRRQEIVWKWRRVPPATDPCKVNNGCVEHLTAHSTERCDELVGPPVANKLYVARPTATTVAKDESNKETGRASVSERCASNRASVSKQSICEQV